LFGAVTRAGYTMTVPSRRSRLSLAALVALSAAAFACTRTIDLGGSLDGADAGPALVGDGGPTVDGETASDTGPAPDAGPGGDASPEVDAAKTPTFVFVTRSVYDANMGGLAGADQRCRSSAAAAKLPGAYRAWLSDATTDAKDRVPDLGPWLEVGTNKVLFATRASFEGFPEAPLLRDEYGDVAPERWWTGTSSNGIKHPQTCLSWSTNSQVQGGMTGHRTQATGRPGKEWTEDSAYSCVTSELQKYSLICFGVN
jgi:hypothetical protein